MTRKTRIILIASLLALFLFAAPVIIGYSLGYRFDFENKKIVQTGGFYFKVWPKGALILLDGKSAKRTDFFFGAAYLDNLLPKRYEVEIQKQNYHTWRKYLQVQEKQVTDAKNIILLPQNPGFNILSKNVEQFFFASPSLSPSSVQNKIILKEIEKDSWALKLLEPRKNIKSHLMTASDISATEKTQLIDLKFSEDSGKVFLQVIVGKETEYFSLDINQSPSLPVLVKEESLLRPENQNSYYIDAQEVLYLLNPDSGSYEDIFGQAKGAQLSPDKKKLLYFSSSEIWVLFLGESPGQPRKLAGEKLLIARFSETIKNAFWLSNHYLVFSSGENIKVAEIDDRQPLNIVNLATFLDPEIFFNNNNKKLYVLSENSFYASEVFAP